jgi:hypothetical protein
LSNSFFEVRLEIERVLMRYWKSLQGINFIFHTFALCCLKLTQHFSAHHSRRPICWFLFRSSLAWSLWRNFLFRRSITSISFWAFILIIFLTKFTHFAFLGTPRFLIILNYMDFNSRRLFFFVFISDFKI